MHYIPPRSWRIDPERGPYSVIYEDDLIGLLCEVYEDGNGTFSWSVSLDGVEWASGGNARTYRSAMDSLNATVDTLASSGTIGRRELILRAADIGTHHRKSFLEEYVARHHLRADPEPAWKFFYHGTNGLIEWTKSPKHRSWVASLKSSFVRMVSEISTIPTIRPWMGLADDFGGSGKSGLMFHGDGDGGSGTGAGDSST